MQITATLCAALLMGTTACQAQSDPVSRTPEFGPTPNGLLYSPRTMQQLRHIVDSLNLKYKVCSLRPQYRSYQQGPGQYVQLKEGDIAQARRALGQGITPEAFGQQFPAAIIMGDQLLISYSETERNRKKPTLTYASIPFSGSGQYHIPDDNVATAPNGARWVIRVSEKTEYTPAYLEAFYLSAPLTQVALPVAYAALVQYADCLVDTTTQIYLPAAKRTSRYGRVNEPASITRFMNYVHEQTQQPKPKYTDGMSQADYEAQAKLYHIWDSLRFERLAPLVRTSKFQSLLTSAVADPESMGATDTEFEEYVAKYHSPKKALQFKRCRVVVGGCSQDDSPRRHAVSIAELAAETVSWETFLRAHLDIMNDRFERNSDGSYAWARRQTYLRELEELDINVPDLMLGITLRIDHANRNHYYGSIGRLGRALAETQHPRELEQRLLGIVADSSLDTYNRVMAYYLFLNYNSHLEDKARQQKNVASLNAAVQKFPAYLVARAEVKPEK